MKRLLALILSVTSLGFALPTLEGTRGTDFVSSALCEDMGFLWFYIASEGYQEHVVFQDSAGSIEAEYDNLAALPVVSLGFTPWHYLEFSAYGSGYFYYNQDNSASAYGLTDVGGHVKGSIPFMPLDNPAVLTMGIDGFFLMSLPFEIDAAANQDMVQYLGYYPFNQAGPEFGGKLLFSLEYQYFSAHLNGGYWYRSTHDIGGTSVQYPQTVISGVGIETSPLKWLNIFADFNLNYGLDMMSPDTLTGINTHASAGLRLPFKLGPMWMFHAGAGADPMNFTSTMSLYAGLGIGGDLIVPKEKVLEGLVKDAETNEPLADAQIRLTGYARDTLVYSNQAGRFKLPELAEDEVIEVSKPGYYPETYSALEFGEELTLTALLEPVKESFIAGVVSDAETTEPIRGTISFNEIYTGEILEPIASDAVSGYFRTKIEPGTYRMQTKAPGYEKDLRTIQIGTSEEKIVDIFLTQEEKPAPPPPQPLEPITVTGFGRGQSQLGFQQMAELEEAVELMKTNPDATVVVSGHTDSVGSDAGNIKLGYARARSAARFLISKGISSERIEVTSGGERFPIRDNRYRSGRQANRRVELRFSRPEKPASKETASDQKPEREKIK